MASASTSATSTGSLDSTVSSTSHSTCEGESCTLLAMVQCHHCPKHVCLKHLIQHNDLNITRTHSLSDDINLLTLMLSKIDSTQSLNEAKETLDQWKTKMLFDIQVTYDYYSNEISLLNLELKQRIDILKENKRQKLSLLQARISALQKTGEISYQQLQPIEHDLEQLRKCLESIKCHVQIDTKDVNIQQLIQCKNVFKYDALNESNQQLVPYKVIHTENLKKFVTSKRYESVLWLDNKKQLSLIDEKFQMRTIHVPTTSQNVPSGVAQSKEHDIVDMKWCSSGNVYLLVFPRHIYSYDPKSNKSALISHINRHKDYPYRCIACFNDNIFISYCVFGICVESWKYPLTSIPTTVGPLRRWDRLATDKTEWISQMDINETTIALVIRTASSTITRFEIRDETLTLIRQVQLEDSIDLMWPYKNIWYLKTMNGKFFTYSNDTSQLEPMTQMECTNGIGEYGPNTLIIGKQNELVFCDT